MSIAADAGSSGDDGNPVDNTLSPSVPSSNASRNSSLDWIDRLADLCSDRLNPILVKETRQALKSRQFTISFWLVLLFGVGWSFLGISLQIPQVYYLPSGTTMLTGYFLILCVPLLLIVPFSAYRSLAMEREDGTYELLSISTLSARQIVTGKLGSALMQIMVYYAALAPCIGFTYLLRGVDIGTIFVLLVGTFLLSVLLATFGLVFAGAGQNRQWQALTSVLLLLLLLIVGWIWCVLMLGMVFEAGYFIYTPEFFIVVGFVLTMYLTIMTMLIFLAAAQNSFVTDNRSTKLRATMLAQQIGFTGWMCYLWIYYNDDDFVPVLCIISAIAWTIYGALMTGELAELSPRAKRDLPQSFLGRMFLAWFNPGASTGYVLSIATLLGVLLLVIAINLVSASYQPDMTYDADRLGLFCALLWSYVVIYLGVGRFVILLLRKVSEFGMAAAVMMQLLLMIAGCGIPYLLAFWLNRYRVVEYSELQITNWAWTLVETIDGGLTSSVVWAIALPVVFVAICVLAANLVLAAREVDAVRIEAPERVREEDA